jgi:hypothetical protein
MGRKHRSAPICRYTLIETRGMLRDGHRAAVSGLIRFGNRADCLGKLQEYVKVNSKANKSLVISILTFSHHVCQIEVALDF